MSIADRIKIDNVQILADDWSTLKKINLRFRRTDGTWQPLTRETYDRGNGATVLLLNKKARTVLLTRQFRYPAYVNGATDLLLEACAGLLDERDPETAIKSEAEEETGVRVTDVTKVFESYMSPGSVTEKLHFFIAEYGENNRVGAGGGLVDDGEDIEVVELPFDLALSMIETGAIVDGKTIMLLLYAHWKKML